MNEINIYKFIGANPYLCYNCNIRKWQRIVIMELISIGKFAKMVGITPTTLRRMHETGERMPCHISKGGTRYYSTEQLDKFLNHNKSEKKVVGYCRVSTSA